MKQAFLRRRGSWLIGEAERWQMASVQGPLEINLSPERQFFQVETTSQEVLLVSRLLGERGMRELRLDSVSVAAKIA